MQDDLIATLKQQIAGLDQHTKSLMKMTLYRISRNANATVRCSLSLGILCSSMFYTLQGKIEHEDVSSELP